MEKRLHFTQHILKHLLPDLSEASAETFEIVTDIDQVSTLLNSLAEAKTNQIVSFQHAFQDIQTDV